MSMTPIDTVTATAITPPVDNDEEVAGSADAVEVGLGPVDEALAAGVAVAEVMSGAELVPAASHVSTYQTK